MGSNRGRLGMITGPEQPEGDSCPVWPAKTGRITEIDSHPEFGIKARSDRYR